METALAPDERLDQRRLDAIAPRSRSNRPVLTPLQAPFPPPTEGHCGDYEKDESWENALKFHTGHLLHLTTRVEQTLRCEHYSTTKEMLCLQDDLSLVTPAATM